MGIAQQRQSREVSEIVCAHQSLKNLREKGDKNLKVI